MASVMSRQSLDSPAIMWRLASKHWRAWLLRRVEVRRDRIDISFIEGTN
jgi:hypothetical protein